MRELNKTEAHEVVILDNMSTGHKQAIPHDVPVEFGDIRDSAFLDSVLSKHKPDAVMVCNASSDSCSAFLCFHCRARIVQRSTWLL